MSIETDELQGPGFFMFFQVPAVSFGSGSAGRSSEPSLFKSEYTLDRLNDEDDEILSIIMAFMFTKK